MTKRTIRIEIRAYALLGRRGGIGHGTKAWQRGEFRFGQILVEQPALSPFAELVAAMELPRVDTEDEPRRPGVADEAIAARGVLPDLATPALHFFRHAVVE